MIQMVQILAIAFSCILLAAVVDLVRRGMLKEKYALLWLASASVLLSLSFWRGLLDNIARYTGVTYPPSLLFLVMFLFLLLIVLHFSVVISNLSEKNKRLAQEIALLKMAFENKTKEREDR